MGTDKVDRLPILVSTMGEKKLLDIPKTELHAMLWPMVYTVPFKNGDWKIWFAPCVSTRPVQILAYYQEHVSFWSSWLEGLFYTSDVVIVFWVGTGCCFWSAHGTKQGTGKSSGCMDSATRVWLIVWLGFLAPLTFKAAWNDQDDYLLIMVIFSGDYVSSQLADTRDLIDWLIDWASRV